MMSKYFGTDGIRGRVGIFPITPDFMLKLGWAIGTVFARDKSVSHHQVLIGKDTRLSGYLFESALEAGLISAGVDVIQLGPMPTPGVAYLTRSMHGQAGIVISASHNPFEDNGIKIFNGQGGKLSDEVQNLIAYYLDQPFIMVEAEKIGRATRLTDAPARYIEFCKNTFPPNLTLDKLHCVVDCANGAMYQIAPRVLKELGAKLTLIHHQPDGLNINQQCGSVHPQSLQAEVLKQGADLGIAFDGDGDRLILVDEKGVVVDGDEIIFILTCAYARQKRLRGGVVGTLMSNMGLEIALKGLNIPFKRSKVGDKHVMDILQTEGWNLGGEGSGHILCLDQTTTGDALIAVLNVIAEMCQVGKSVGTLKLGMTKFTQKLINVKIAQGTALDLIAHPQVQALLKAKEQALSRLHANAGGRILLRASGTEPIIRIMVEGEVEHTAYIDNIAQEIAETLTLSMLCPIATSISTSISTSTS